MRIPPAGSVTFQANCMTLSATFQPEAGRALVQLIWVAVVAVLAVGCNVSVKLASLVPPVFATAVTTEGGAFGVMARAVLTPNTIKDPTKPIRAFCFFILLSSIELISSIEAPPV